MGAAHNGGTLALVLRSVADGLWVAEHPLKIAGLALGSRMTVARLSDGSSWLHSPVRFVPSTDVRAVGPVSAIVAPSKVHHLMVKDWTDAYGDARLFGAPGLSQKRPDLSFHTELGDEAPPEWDGVLDQLVIRGAPWVNEVLFLHRPSRTLIVTDAAFNIPAAPDWWTRGYLRAFGALGGFAQSRMFKLCVRDRRAVRESIDRVLAWDFDRVIVTHGEILESGGKRAIEDVFAWL